MAIFTRKICTVSVFRNTDSENCPGEYNSYAAAKEHAFTNEFEPTL